MMLLLAMSACSVIAAVMVTLHDNPARGVVGVWVVAAMFVGITVRWWFLLRRFERSVAYETSTGIRVVDDGGAVPPREQFEAVVAATIASWARVPGFDLLRVRKRLDGLIVWVRPAPFPMHGNGPLMMGLAKPRSKRRAVGIGAGGVERSALAHELGHIIGDVNEAELKRLADQHGVPY